MRLTASRLLMAAAAAIFAFGGVVHSVAFSRKAASAIEGSKLGAFFVGEMKVLWLADSTTLIALALLFSAVAAKPNYVAKPLVFLLALIPAATTALLYFYLGPFYAAHLLLAGTFMVIASASLRPS